jgi:long-chain acyl-CoA synthetase
VSADDSATIRAGVAFSHGELLAEVRAMISKHRELIGAANSMLIQLPLAHPVGGVFSLACVYTRTTLAHSSNAADLATFRPTAVVAEAGLLAEVYATAKLRAHAEDRGRIFDAAERVAIEHSATFAPTVALRGKHLMAGKFVYPKLRAVLGGRCTAVICVGEPPDERLAHFFRGIGIPVHSS